MISGIHFEVGLEEVLQKTISLALRVFFAGVNKMLESGQSSRGRTRGRHLDLNYSLDCQGVGTDGHKWENGPMFYKCVLHKNW